MFLNGIHQDVVGKRSVNSAPSEESNYSKVAGWQVKFETMRFLCSDIKMLS
jgi:hypothetical protein